MDNDIKSYKHYENELTPLQLELRNSFLKSNRNINVFVTLTFYSKTGVSYQQARKIFGKFIFLLKKHFYGKKSNKKFPMLAVVEDSRVELGGSDKKKNFSTHIHFVGGIPGDYFESLEIVRKCWLKSSRVAGDPRIYCPNSNKWYQFVESEKAKLSVIQYTIKTCRLNTDNVLLDFVQFRKFKS